MISFTACHHKQQEKVIPFCTRLKRVKITGRRPAFAPNYKLQWANHTVLHVYFMEDFGALNDKIISIANTWSNFSGISFKKTDQINESQIRVTFKHGGYASAVGIECKEHSYDDKPTMFLQGLDTLQDMKEFTRVVLHESGHAIGLEHELRKPAAQIPWDTAAVYKYYSDHYGWNRTDVDANIFQAFITPKQYDEFDSTSIMVYAVPDTLTKGHYTINWPDQLSKSDKVDINKWYPKSN